MFKKSNFARPQSSTAGRPARARSPTTGMKEEKRASLRDNKTGETALHVKWVAENLKVR